MSAQLSQHVTTRVLVAEKSENAAHELDSILRNAGIATKMSITDDLAHVAQTLSRGEADIALITDKIEGVDKLLPRIRENSPHIPVILLTHANSEGLGWSVASAIGLGATDAVPADCADHLALVVKRELEHVCQRDHYIQTRRALKEAEQRCQLLLQGSKAAIAYVHEGMHIHANEGYLDLFGYSDLDELCGESLVDILSAESATLLKSQLKAIRSGREECTFDFHTTPESGGEVRGTMTLENSKYEGEPCLQVTVRKQVDADNQAAAPAPAVQSEEANELGLSGFVKSAETLTRASNDQSFILFANLDHFSQLKKTYGLIGAENISRKVWHNIQSLASDYPVAKLNNQQYVIAATAPTTDNVKIFAEMLRSKIGELILEAHDKTVRPTLSITCAEVAEGGGDGEVEEAMDVAYDGWLELVEREQSNVVSMPATESAEDDAEWDDARIVLKQITEAIEKKMFVLLFQPIISLRGDSDEHYEVFLRMTATGGEKIEPGRFLQTAIDNNVAGKIDRWVILQSIKMLSVHRAKGHATRLTINLTSNSVTDPEFLQWLTVAIKAARLPSDAVIFQITEKDATTYLRQTREFVEGLRSMHCRASLSRFGLVEDPFETLRHIPVDMVKLDGEAIAQMDEDDVQAKEILETIKKLQGNGKLTVVPMVENANVLSTLWQAGANYIQGHYLQEPTTEMDYDFSTEE